MSGEWDMKIISYNDLEHIVKTGDVISIAALSVGNLPVEILKNLAEQHDENKKVNDLTFVVSLAISDFDAGFNVNMFILWGIVKRIITSFMIAWKFTVKAIKNNEIVMFLRPRNNIDTQHRH